jgi:hypothetical protein
MSDEHVMPEMQRDLAEGMNVAVKKLREWADWGDFDRMSATIKDKYGEMITITVDEDRVAHLDIGGMSLDLGHEPDPFKRWT